MKVLHIGKYFPPYFGGIEKVNFDCVEELNSNTIPTDELCFNHEKGNKVEQKNYTIYRCSTLFTIFSTPFSLSIFQRFKKIKNNYDIVHVHVPNPIGMLLVLFSNFRGKLVLHWHSDIVKQSKLKVIFGPIERRVLKKADHIIATSENYLEASEDLKKYKEKCTVIPLGINPSDFIENLDFRTKINEKYLGKKVVFSLGRLIYYKGFEFLIHAAKELDGSTIVLIGGVGKLHEELQALIKKNNLSDKVELLGKINFNEIGEYYRRADLFCLPSTERSEAFGVVLIEALSFGCPIVTTNIEGSGVPWVNEHNYSGINVEPKNAADLTIAITEILKDPTKQDNFSKNAKSRFQNNFTLSTMVNSIQNVYKSLDK